jgi:hypothetical protein
VKGTPELTGIYYPLVFSNIVKTVFTINQGMGRYNGTGFEEK